MGSALFFYDEGPREVWREVFALGSMLSVETDKHI